MGSIRKHRSGFSDPAIIKDSYENENETFYCTECLGEQNKLYPRANYSGSDADQWFECHVCHDIKHINELKHTSKLESFAVPSDNPYERKDVIVGLNNKINSTPRQKELDRFKEELDSIPDQDERADGKRIGMIKFVNDAIDNY